MRAVAARQRAGGQRRHGASLHIVRRRRMGFRAFRRVHGLHARLWREICAQSFAEAAKTQNAIIECANQMRNIPEIPAIKYLLMRLA